MICIDFSDSSEGEEAEQPDMSATHQRQSNGRLRPFSVPSPRLHRQRQHLHLHPQRLHHQRRNRRGSLRAYDRWGQKSEGRQQVRAPRLQLPCLRLTQKQPRQGVAGPIPVSARGRQRPLIQRASGHLSSAPPAAYPARLRHLSSARSRAAHPGYGYLATQAT